MEATVLPLNILNQNLNRRSTGLNKNEEDQICYIISSFANTHMSEKELCASCNYNATKGENTECYDCDQDIFGLKVMTQYNNRDPFAPKPKQEAV